MMRGGSAVVRLVVAVALAALAVAACRAWILFRNQRDAEEARRDIWRHMAKPPASERDPAERDAGGHGARDAASASAGPDVAQLVGLLNARDTRGLTALLEPGHQQGDAAGLLAERERIGTIATWVATGVVQMNFNGALSESRSYELTAVHGTARLTMHLAQQDGRWVLDGVKLEERSEGAPPAAPGPPHVFDL
jgi:hypothetical protein